MQFSSCIIALLTVETSSHLRQQRVSSSFVPNRLKKHDANLILMKRQPFHRSELHRAGLDFSTWRGNCMARNN